MFDGTDFAGAGGHRLRRFRAAGGRAGATRSRGPVRHPGAGRWCRRSHLSPGQRDLRPRSTGRALHAAHPQPLAAPDRGGGLRRRARRRRRQGGRLSRQARLPGAGVGPGRHRRLAAVALAGGGLPLLGDRGFIRGARGRSAQRRRHRRGHLHRALCRAAAPAAGAGAAAPARRA